MKLPAGITIIAWPLTARAQQPGDAGDWDCESITSDWWCRAAHLAEGNP
jgi:hypothetical protein